MTTISSEKIDLLIYGPIRPILENGFPDQFTVHRAESGEQLNALPADVKQKLRGIAVTYHTMHTGKEELSQLPKVEMIASFGVGYDHIDVAYSGRNNKNEEKISLKFSVPASKPVAQR